MPMQCLMLLLICMLLLTCMIYWKLEISSNSILEKICVKFNPAIRNSLFVLQNRLESRHLSTVGSCSGKLKSVNLSAKFYFPLWFPCNLAWWRCSLKARLHCKIVATFIFARFLCSANVLNTIQQKILICVVVWSLYFHCILYFDWKNSFVDV